MAQLILEITGILISLVGVITSVVLLWQKIRDRKRPLIRDILKKEVYYGLRAIRHNREFLKNEETDWVQVEKHRKNSESILVSDLRALSMRNSDQIVSERFAEMYPEMVDILNRHDRLLLAVEENARKLMYSNKEPLEDYIKYRQLTHNDGTEVEVQEVLNYLLIGDRPNKYDERPNYWEEYSFEIKSICSSHAREAYDDFYAKKREYHNFSNKVKQKLTGIREELEAKYGVARFESQ